MDKNNSIKAAVQQPNFFPWLGYFECIDLVDVFVFLDDVAFGSKPKRMNRNHISSHNGDKINFTMSVSTPSLKSEIRDCKVIRNSDFFYYRDLLKRNYKSAPYFKKTFNVIEEIYSFKNDSVSEFNINLITLICSIMGIKTKFKISSKDLNCKCKPAEDHLIKILKKIKATEFYASKTGVDIGLYDPKKFKNENINFFQQEYKHPTYNHNNFVPYLSIIDLLFYNFDDALKIIRNGRSWTKKN